MARLLIVYIVLACLTASTSLLGPNLETDFFGDNYLTNGGSRRGRLALDGAPRGGVAAVLPGRLDGVRFEQIRSELADARDRAPTPCAGPSGSLDAIGGGGPGGEHGPGGGERDPEGDPDGDHHSISSDTHEPNSDVHHTDSSAHYENSDTHSSRSDLHLTSSHSHSDNSDVHAANSDSHTVDSCTHYASSDTHAEGSDSHTTQSSQHSSLSDSHHEGSDSHSGASESHFTSSDTHAGLSDTHTTDSSTSTGEPDPPCSAIGQPNRGEALVNGSPWISIDVFDSRCQQPMTVQHKIITYNTPEGRSLFGKLRLNVVSGDPNVATILYQGNPYSPGSPIPVAEHGHVGCGVHTWHQGSIPFLVVGKKEGTVTFEAEVDPDPDVSGDGAPGSRAQFQVNVLESGLHEIRYKTFIQCPMVLNPDFINLIAFFSGDNRFFHYSEGTSRSYQNVKVTTEEPGGIAGSPTQFFGETEGWLFGQVWEPAPGTPCPYAALPGQSPIATDTPPHTASNLNVTAGLRAGPYPETRAVAAHFHLSADNPLEPLACPIDGDIDVEIYQCGDRSWYRLFGERDGFPAHEIYIDGTLVYSYDPIAAGASPLALCLPPQPVPDTGWIEITW